MRTASSILLLSLGAGCAAAASPTGSRESAIYWGDPEDGYPGVVQLSIALGPLSGAMCSGTLVSPRVVVTAQHCTVNEESEPLEPSAIEVFTGPSGLDGGYGVREIRTPDVFGMTGSDIAVLVLEEELLIETYPFATTWDAHPGDPIKLVGYGKDENGGSGRKRIGDNEVDYIFDTYFTTVGEAGCSGDSGGPAFDAGGVLVGVTVNTLGGWVGEDTCLSGVTGLTRVDAHRDLVETAVEDAWVCDDADAETCGDGRDNDCNMLIDDACLELGAPCSDSIECESGDCRETGDGLHCTVGCGSCPEGFYCDEIECGEGACVPGAAGAGLVGDPCEQDTDCASLSCLSEGAEALCLRPCTVEAGCGGGDRCVDANEDGCGACLPEGDGAPFGALCEADSDCGSGECVADAFGSICSGPCGDGCGEGFYCDPDDRCARARTGGSPDGSPCASAASCESGECTETDGRLVCTSPCGAPDDCAAGFECAEGRCAPSGAIDGEACGDDEDCLSGLCGRFDGFEACTDSCGEEAPCAEGLVCEVAAEGAWCRPLTPPAAPPEEEDAGCGCRAPGAGTASLVWLWLPPLVALACKARRLRRACATTADPK